MTRWARSRKAASTELCMRSNADPLDVATVCGAETASIVEDISYIARDPICYIFERKGRNVGAMSNEPLLLGGISDDFTGGLELASMMARDGLRTRLLTRLARPSDLEDLDVAVIALKSRVARPKALCAISPRRSMSSASAACARSSSNTAPPSIPRRAAISVPAPTILARPPGRRLHRLLPRLSRRRAQGLSRLSVLGGQLISNSPKRFDPLTPMRDPNLVRVLQQQTATRVGLLPHSILAQGAAATVRHAAKLEAEGIGYAIADALDEADLQVTAEASVDWPLMTGGSSVAVYYPELWRKRGGLTGAEIGTAAGAPPPPGGPAVVLAGSCAERTFDQLAHFGRRRPVLFLDPARALNGAGVEGLVAEVLAFAERELAKGPVAIATSARPEEVAKLQRRLGRRRAAHLAEEILARIASGLYARGIRRFVVSGGETSGGGAGSPRGRSAGGRFRCHRRPVPFDDAGRRSRVLLSQIGQARACRDAGDGDATISHALS